MNSKVIVYSLVIAGVLAFGPRVAAHHSFAAMYDANKPIRLVGKLTRIEWTNPHSYFYIEVSSGNAKANSWTIEGAGPGALSRRGFSRGDIKIGDLLVVEGYLAKSGGRVVDGRLVTLPDGRVINGGTAGDGGPGDTTKPQPKRPGD